MPTSPRLSTCSFFCQNRRLVMKKPAMYFQSPMFQVPDKSAPPILSPTIHAQFYPAIGELIVQWALMEQNLNILVWALLTFNRTEEPGWKECGFDKRHDLLKAQWAKFSSGFSDLSKFLDSPNKSVRVGKVLRDSIAHKEMVLGFRTDGNHSVQFYNKTRTKQKSKPYHLSDFQEAISATNRAAGFFFRITDPSSAWPLPQPDIHRLRSLPNTDHLRLPT
jgi:hypothetical protein